jgi:hypothetical protein
MPGSINIAFMIRANIESAAPAGKTTIIIKLLQRAFLISKEKHPAAC